MSSGSASMSTEPVKPDRNVLVDAVGRMIVRWGMSLTDRRIGASSRPFDRAGMLRPHDGSRVWGWTHFGVFVPGLPGPYRYLNTMTLIGATGAVIFDNDYLVDRDPRRLATVLSSTALGDRHHYAAYDIDKDCRFAPDGSRLQWGSDLTIQAHGSQWSVQGRYAHMDVDLSVTTTSAVSYFIKTPIYDHLSLLATCTGNIRDESGTVEFAVPCTVEYARSISPQSLTSRIVPPRLKLPVDFFTYQIVQLDETTQLLLTDVRAAGATACRLAHVRSAGEPAGSVYTDVTLDVLDYQPEPMIDPVGRAMRLPRTWRWTVRGASGDVVLELVCEFDSPPRYGHGRGYVGAYTYRGRWNGDGVSGSAYVEWVDCERNFSHRRDDDLTVRSPGC